ncbi:hypothetical protein L1887_44894 [Cichorium endivia]|nr:hypothetical protein L1887_44894 [Cichorium endivia]
MTLAATGVGALRLPVSLLWNGTDEPLRQIWLTIRLPRVLLALAIGGSLALAGCVMQGLFRNPLADPGLLGISSGAALAVSLWVVLPLSLPALVMLYAPMLAAFLGALAATFVIFLLSRQRDASLSRLLLVGIAINALCGAAVGVLSWLSNDAQLRQLSLWGMGSLGQAQWSTLLAVASLMVPTALIIWRLAGALNLLQLGDEEAHYLGVEVAAVQRILLLCSALLVAAAVAVSGVIGFVGLVVPHLVRMWLGADHRAVLPGSVLAGALLLLVADTLARSLVTPAEMPVGLLTSLLGAPWFLLAGTPLAAWQPETLSRYRAVMRQSTQLGFDWPVEAVVGMGRAPWTRTPEASVIEEVMAITGCLPLAGRRFAALSGGEQQRIQLARALAQLWPIRWRAGTAHRSTSAGIRLTPRRRYFSPPDRADKNPSTSPAGHAPL